MAENSTKLHTPGDYDLKKLVLKSFQREVDIRNLMIELNIFEDIFSNTISGHIILGDALNLPELMPIIGEETLEIKFASSNNGNFTYFDKVFDIYKMSDTSLEGDKAKTYVLYFTSRGYTVNLNKRICRSYNDYPHNIVLNIYEKTMGLDGDRIFVENCKHTKNLVIPNWTPFRTIDYLAQTSLSKAFNTPNYLFFENRIGHYFVSLDYLISRPTSQTLKYERTNTDINQYDMNRVSTYFVDKSFDISSNSINGMYGSTLITHDILKKKIQTFEYDYIVDFNKSKHTEPNPDKLTHTRAGQLKNNIMLFPRNYSNEFVEQWMQARKSKIAQFDNYVLTITMPGNSNQVAGNIVNFEIPSTQNNDKQTKDIYLSGNYIISKLNHKLTSENYDLILELRKDAFKKG